MPSAATAERQTNAQPGFPVPAAAATSPGGQAPQQSAQAGTVATPNEAVEAALNAVELLAAGNTSHAVNLQFSVGNHDLSLRVELKNGTVQATFATDSAQLRSDLANEWQSSASGNSQSSLNLAQPHFTSAGGDSPQQQGRGGASGSEPQFTFSGKPGSGAFGSAGADSEAPLAPVAPSSSLHLQAFA
jgi:hypothetical protein